MKRRGEGEGERRESGLLQKGPETGSEFSVPLWIFGGLVVTSMEALPTSLPQCDHPHRGSATVQDSVLFQTAVTQQALPTPTALVLSHFSLKLRGTWASE